MQHDLAAPTELMNRMRPDKPDGGAPSSAPVRRFGSERGPGKVTKRIVAPVSTHDKSSAVPLVSRTFTAAATSKARMPNAISGRRQSTTHLRV